MKKIILIHSQIKKNTFKKYHAPQYLTYTPYILSSYRIVEFF
jgi:hypothetical protein